MKFIMVHNIDGGDLLINTDKVATIYPGIKGGAIVNYFDGSTAPVTETVDELDAILRPKRSKEAELVADRTEQEDCLPAERFLLTMQDGVNRECDQRQDCETCRCKELGAICWFHSLTYSEAKKIAAEYERFRNFEQQENEEKTEKTGKWIPVQAHGDPVAFYYCSECKEQIVLSETREDLLPKHCPQCGARMVNGI